VHRLHPFCCLGYSAEGIEPGGLQRLCHAVSETFRRERAKISLQCSAFVQQTRAGHEPMHEYQGSLAEDTRLWQSNLGLFVLAMPIASHPHWNLNLYLPLLYCFHLNLRNCLQKDPCLFGSLAPRYQSPPAPIRARSRQATVLPF